MKKTFGSRDGDEIGVLNKITAMNASIERRYSEGKV